MTPRKHAELIKAWADGAEIQAFDGGFWYDCNHPLWNEETNYRLKPVPKEDYVESGSIYFYVNGLLRTTLMANVTFSGETGEAKKVEIVK